MAFPKGRNFNHLFTKLGLLRAAPIGVSKLRERVARPWATKMNPTKKSKQANERSRD